MIDDWLHIVIVAWPVAVLLGLAAITLHECAAERRSEMGLPLFVSLVFPGLWPFYPILLVFVLFEAWRAWRT